MAAEAIPSTPRIRDVRIQPGSGNFNPENARGRRGLIAEFDISPPFESDQNMVTGFDRRGSWVPFMIGDNHDGMGEFDIKRMEENAVELEKELIMKELETLDFLEALGSTKKILQDLKLELHQRAVRRIENHEHLRTYFKEMNDEHCHRNPLASPDRNQVRLNLGKTMDDLAMIQSYGESLNMKSEEEKDFLGAVSLAEELNSLRLKPTGPDQRESLNTENLPVNPQCEQIKMVVDETNDTAFQIQSKTCLRTAEMRLVAARKMEEAARAAEALAIAELTVLSSGINQDGLCFPEPPPKSPSTLQALMNEDLSTEFSRREILRKLEEANEEVKQSKQALEMASQRVEIASVKQLEAEDALRQWNIESWKDQKAIRAKRTMKEDKFPRRSFLNHVNQQHERLPKQMLKRNASTCNVLNQEQVHTVDEKQLAAPRRKFRFIHNKLPETE